MILNNMTLIEILPLKDLYTIHKNHDRLKVFVNKGRKCVICDREGVLLLLREDKGGGLHVDLYTDDFILMTVDHIVPKAVGRKIGWTTAQIEDMLNKQPMCYPCNTKKSDSFITNEEYREKRLKNGYPQKIKGVEIIRQLVHNESIFSKDLTGVIA